MENQERYLAEQYIRYTSRSIFLTGKAGTGKTTFLQSLIAQDKRNTIIVAPTGVAAIQAGGMTIHSTFQLPISSFLPVTHGGASPDLFTDRHQLASNQRLRKERRQLLIELELLVIDEISMVRADLLDAVNFTLQRIRQNQQPFGGVQVLAIGDLYQLAPVVNRASWATLSEYYSSPFFFDSMVWSQTNAISIELQKVYRQEDEQFITLLNHIRNGEATEQDLSILNARFDPAPSLSETITLTTHNHKAHKINEAELSKLTGKSYQLEAEIKGRFATSSFPTDEKIELRKGAQVMCIRNHPEGLYFNGKIGTVDRIEQDTVWVKAKGDSEAIPIEPIEWKNTRYSVDQMTKEIHQEDIGSFEQYPLKLAWAVTVHKSQGLTFDAVMLDLEDTFAPGQLYVALSRCRSLEGLTLTSKIKLNNVLVDARIATFQEKSKHDRDLLEQLEKDKASYDDQRLIHSFRLDKLQSYLLLWEQLIKEADIPEAADALLFVKDLKVGLNELQQISMKFSNQLAHIIQQSSGQESTFQQLKDRANKATHYFTQKIHDEYVIHITDHIKSYKVKSNSRKYIKEVDNYLSSFWQYIEKLYAITYRNEKLLLVKPTYIRSKGSMVGKKVKGQTYKITLDLFTAGRTLQQIAKERSLTIGTVRSHMSRWIKEEKVSLYDLMPEDRAQRIWKHIKDTEETNTSVLKEQLPFDADYHEIRWVLNFFRR